MEAVYAYIQSSILLPSLYHATQLNLSLATRSNPQVLLNNLINLPLLSPFWINPDLDFPNQSS